jgi:hypothetical protein
VTLRIGIDFDNTIACYDRAFGIVAERLGLLEAAAAPTKAEVKTQLLARSGGDLDWQRLQGQMYGRYMLDAYLFPGVREFLALCRLRGIPVFVVSHKTEFGHFDVEQVSLRGQALKWMEAKGLFDAALGFSPEQVFFEATREAKLARVAALGCSHFIDDLPEVFAEADFPVQTRGLLFAPNAEDDVGGATYGSWRAIAQALLGNWGEDEVATVACRAFPELEVVGAKRHPGRGNSRIYQLSSKTGRCYCLKVYPDRQRDARPRLEVETGALATLSERGYPVPRVVASDCGLGWATYTWETGEPYGVADTGFVAAALDFVGRLRNDSPALGAGHTFGAASEACLCIAEVECQVRRRFDRLRAVADEELADFLDREFTPVLGLACTLAAQWLGEEFNRPLEHTWQILSPSDFGSHNALRLSEGALRFLDFEYFGWDDPVKLVADFYWHPGMDLATHLREHWITAAQAIFADDPGFSVRLAAGLPWYGLRWCLILLNEYLREGMARRVHADPDKGGNQASTRFAQLAKSRRMLDATRERLQAYG